MSNKTSKYSLKEICQAAKLGNIAYQSQHEKPQIDALNLGYSVEELVKCLCSLKDSQFIGSKEYTLPQGNKAVTFDVYITTCTSSEGHLDTL
ncbi:MAG: hypothetical protein DRR08_24935 [Candidatus Parabeggiatoa sp. nov. 2]|nr:MAG: hypothetical protein B6247_10815 [Beggiatoa sp. 4572_84]RKZ55213.1 MAG: hypothetical protein DRR08_24935 [Gammaproteobacteria bacterium]HEC85825.1 hypothetical protein [Thioploca sp.]